MNNRVPFRQSYALALLACLFALLSACTAVRTGMTNGQKLRVGVGEIEEISMTTRADTNWQLTAASDNQEIVDVSRKPPVAPIGGGPSSAATDQSVFLIKGVTAGTASVVFMEKRRGTDGSGQVKKTYVVTVINK